MIRIHLILERGQETPGTEPSHERSESEIEENCVMGKRDCQRGDGRMEHLLMMWGNRGSRAWTHGEG